MSNSATDSHAKVWSNILLAIDLEDLSALVLLELSATFNRADHQVIWNIHTDLVQKCSTDSRFTRSVVISTSGIVLQHHAHQLSSVVCRRHWSSVRSHSCCTEQNCCRWSSLDWKYMLPCVCRRYTDIWFLPMCNWSFKPASWHALMSFPVRKSGWRNRIPVSKF